MVPYYMVAIMCVTFIVLVPSHYCISQGCVECAPECAATTVCQEYVLPRNTIWFRLGFLRRKMTSFDIKYSLYCHLSQRS